MADKDIADVINMKDFINNCGDEKKDIVCNDYKWSSYFNEKIVILYYQLKRTHDKREQSMIREMYNELLQETFLSNSIDEPTRLNYITLLYRIMLHTRDIVAGKGEYNLFYILLGEWVKMTENIRCTNQACKNIDYKTNTYRERCVNVIDCLDTLAKNAIYSLVYLEGSEKPYGCWKDIKYFLNYMRYESGMVYNITNLPIFTYAITLIVKQLRVDVSSKEPSLLSKWVPREKSKKFGWIAKHIACAYFLDVLTSGSQIKTKNNTIILSNRTAERKCLTKYRQMIANLNRKIKTPQINQCEKTWHAIDFEKSVSKITIARQRNAFRYINKTGYIKGNNIDRLICKKNYEKYIEDCMIKDTNPNNTNSLLDIVNTAIEIMDKERYRRQFGYTEKEDDMIKADNLEKDSINSQWDNRKKNFSLKNYVSLIDTSGSMDGEPILAALGVGCSIAESSRLGKGVITFSEAPKWVDLSDDATLSEMVNALMTTNDWGMNTNIVKAMQIVLARCVEKELTPEEIKETVFVIFTDMKIYEADKSYSLENELYIKNLFKEEGLKSRWSKPFEPPKIIYWDMRNTGEFPVVTYKNNISVITGFTTSILETFCKNGTDALTECNPWSCLNDQLNVKRYDWVNKVINNTDLFKNVKPLTGKLVDEAPEQIVCDNKEISKSWWSW